LNASASIIEIFVGKMGAGPTKTYIDDGEGEKTNYVISSAQKFLQKREKVPLDVMVSHYTPSSFPLIPIVNANNAAICRESWKTIISTDTPDPYGGPTMSGMTAFYNEFYQRYYIIHRLLF
jgi:hypothetical protein